MKKYLLLLLFVTLSFASAFAVAGLNPYAYKLGTVTQSDNNRKMTFQYWLNAPATSVSISISYTLDDSQHVMNYSGTTNEGENNVTVSTAGIPANTPISWSVTVNKASNSEPKQVSTNYRFYCPQGVAVDKDPMSNNFGRILVTETLHGKTGTSGRNYVSSTSATGGTIQAGLYAFDARFNLINAKGVPYKGGKSFTQKLGKFTSGYGNFDGGHQPYQVKISEDGRIFISCGDIRDYAVVVWEADPSDLTKEWTPILRNEHIGWNKSTYQAYDANGKFYAGFNCSMDVTGRGEDLKLLLYSADYDGVRNHHADNFRLDEYPIGTYQDNDWKGTIKNIWKPYDNKEKYGVVYDCVNVIYDGEGGYWLGANRGNKQENEPNLVHVRADGTQDQYSYSYDFFGGAGIMLHKPTYEGQGTTWMFKGLSKSTTANGRFGIWKIYKENGATKRSRIWTVISTGLGRNHNAYAIDYAENLFVVGNFGERIVAFALPYNGTKTTPARSTFELQPVDNSITYMVTTTSTPSGYGRTSGDGLYHYGESVTVTANSADYNRYKFKEWKVNGTKVSSDSIYTFTVTGAKDLTAVFEEKTYRVEYFNLFHKYDGEFQDITTYWKTNDQLDHERNSRLWRLFQVEYNKHAGTSQLDQGESKGSSGSNRLMYYVLKFVNTNFGTYDTPSERCDLIEDFLDNDGNQSNFYWLGQYIESVVGIDDINKYFDGKYTTNIWGFYLQSFINRTKKSHNQGFDADAVSVGGTINGNYKVVDFTSASLPTNWRPWWQELAAKLPLETNYQPVPTDWNRYTLPQGWSIADANGSTTYYPCNTWCQWNWQSDKLLGWYYGDKNPDTWTDDPDQVDIVHNINKDGNLIAIWVPKEIHEEKNNYDVTKLMTTQGTTHDVRVYHPLQADMYNTICLPFNVTSLPSDLDGSTVLRLVSSDLENEELSEETLSDNNVNIYFEQVDFAKGEQMYAGYPYLIMPQSDITGWVTFPGVKRDSVYTGEGKSIVTDYVSMHGHINPSTIEVDPNTLFLVTDNRLATPSESGVMLGLRGYFTLEGSAAAYSLGEQSVMHIGKKVTTDTPDAPEVEEEVETVQPTTQESHKVMYNGNIYILRGDEVYTLSGHRVK